MLSGRFYRHLIEIFSGQEQILQDQKRLLRSLRDRRMNTHCSMHRFVRFGVSVRRLDKALLGF